MPSAVACMNLREALLGFAQRLLDVAVPRDVGDQHEGAAAPCRRSSRCGSRCTSIQRVPPSGVGSVRSYDHGPLLRADRAHLGLDRVPPPRRRSPRRTCGRRSIARRGRTPRHTPCSRSGSAGRRRRSRRSAPARCRRAAGTAAPAPRATPARGARRSRRAAGRRTPIRAAASERRTPARDPARRPFAAPGSPASGRSSEDRSRNPNASSAPRPTHRATPARAVASSRVRLRRRRTLRRTPRSRREIPRLGPDQHDLPGQRCPRRRRSGARREEGGGVHRHRARRPRQGSGRGRIIEARRERATAADRAGRAGFPGDGSVGRRVAPASAASSARQRSSQPPPCLPAGEAGTAARA